MSSRGFEFRTIRSAILDGSIVPRSFSTPRKCAPCRLAISRAPIGPIAVAAIQTSQCDPIPCSVRADGSVASFGGNVGDRLRDQRETIVGRRPVREAARVWDHLPPRREPQQFFIVPEIVLLEEVFLVPRSRAAHHERW